MARLQEQLLPMPTQRHSVVATAMLKHKQMMEKRPDPLPRAHVMGPRRWHAEISCATEETPQGAANVQPAGRVGPNAASMAMLLLRYTIAVWAVLAR